MILWPKEGKNPTLNMWLCEFSPQLKFFYQNKFIYEYKIAWVENVQLSISENCIQNLWYKQSKINLK